MHAVSNVIDFSTAGAQVVTRSPRGTDVEIVRRDTLQRLPELLAMLFPAGVRAGNKFTVGNIEGGEGYSLQVEITGHRAGMWHDFATGEGGDVFHLWAARHHLDIDHEFPKVINGLQEWLGTAPLNAAPAAPSPAPAKKPPLGDATASWDYLGVDGALLARVTRYDPVGGKKQYRPYDAVTGKHGAPAVRPLYNQPGMAQAESVVFVEGEKCADALISIGVCATAAMSGASAPVDKTDWTPLQGKHVIIWPDNDDAGRGLAGRVAEFLTKVAASVRVLTIPADKPEKWDAADAVADGEDVAAFLQDAPAEAVVRAPPIAVHEINCLVEDKTPMPPDLIAPRVMTQGGIWVIGGAPKARKSDLMLALLTHMAAGVPFLGFTPPRALRIFYLQSEIEKCYLRERLHDQQLPPDVLECARGNLFMTEKTKLLINTEGANQIIETVELCFPDEPVDIIAIDPLRNVFDGGKHGSNENDNGAMIEFMRRVDMMRDALNPAAGVIMAHHTRKLTKQALEDDPFNSLAGGGALRGYYTTGTVMYAPDENESARKMLFELRNGAPIKPKVIDKRYGQWELAEEQSQRIVNQSHGANLDAERERKQDAILELICAQARQGKLYTVNAFCATWDNRLDLGSKSSIRDRINVLAHQGFIKFHREGGRNLMCIKGMEIPDGQPVIDKVTGEVLNQEFKRLFPTHRRIPNSGDLVEVENPRVWVYADSVDLKKVSNPI